MSDAHFRRGSAARAQGRRAALLLIAATLVSVSVLPLRAGAPLATPIGPDGGVTKALAASLDGRVLYAATAAAGLFRSVDGGAVWQRIGAGPRGEVAALAVDAGSPEILYAASTAGLLASRDGGATWSSLNGRIAGRGGCRPSPGPDCARATAVVTDPLRPGVLLAAFSGWGLLFRSADAGLTWQRSAEGLAGVVVLKLLARPSRPGTFYAATSDGLRESRDEGRSWSFWGLRGSRVLDLAVGADEGVAALAVSLEGCGHFFSCLTGWRRAPDESLFRRRLVAPILGIEDFAAAPSTPGLCLAASVFGLFRSVDGGASWRQVDRRPAREVVPALADSDLFFAAASGESDAAVLRSDDAGETWRAAGSGLAVQAARQILVDPRNPGALYVATAGGTVRRTRDGGRSWRRLLAQPRGGPASAVLDPFSADLLLLADADGLWRSADRGGSWSLVRPGAAGALAADPARQGTFYATAAPEGVLRTRDGGRSWQRLPLPAVLRPGLVAVARPQAGGATSPVFMTSLDFNPGGSPYFFARLRRSADDGESWSEVLSIPLDFEQPYFTALLPVTGAPGGLLAAFAEPDPDNLRPKSGGIYRTDGGGPPRRLVLSPESPAVLSLTGDAKDPSRIFAGTPRGGVFASRDGGRTWKALEAGLPLADVTGLALDPFDTKVLYAALDGASVYRIVLSD